MKSRTIVTALGLVVAALLLGSCMERGRPVDDDPAVELRTYVVPDGFDTREIRRYVSSSLTAGETILGTAVEYPNGMLAVTAPPGVHDGVAQLLRDLEQRGPGSTRAAPHGITVRYWAILGKPRDGHDAEDRPRERRLRSNGPLQPVVEQLEATYGPMELDLLEQLQITSVASGDEASIRGRNMLVSQRVYSGPVTLASVSVQVLSGRGGFDHGVESRVRLDPGKFVVLAQSAYNPKSGALPGGWGTSNDVMLFLVVARQAS